jgi:hypothetical protein
LTMMQTAQGLVGACGRDAWVRRIGAVLAVAMMGGSLPAAAQVINPNNQPPSVRDNDDGPIRAGAGLPGLAGFPGRGLHLGFSVVSRYESNVSRGAVADDGFRVRPQIDAGYGLNVGRQGVFVQGSLARDMIFGTDGLPNRNRYQLGAGVDYQLSRCSGQAGASWQRSLAFQSDATAFGAFQQERTNFGLSATCRLGAALSINGSVTRGIAETEVGFGTAFNVNSWSYSAGLGFGSAAFGQLSLTASQTDSQMPGRLIVTPQGIFDDGLRQRSVRLGYSRQLGSRINFALGASYLSTVPSTDTQVLLIDDVLQLVPRDTFNGLGYDASLDFRLSPRIALQLTTGRSSFANPQVGARFTVSDNYAASVIFTPNPRYTFVAGYNRRNNDYRGGFSSQLDPFVRLSDKLDRIFLQASARLGQRLRLGLDVTHNQRRSNPALLNFSSTGVGLSLNFDLGRPK